MNADFKGEVEFYGAFLFFFLDFLTLFYLSITVLTKPRRSTIAQWPSARLCGATKCITYFGLYFDDRCLRSLLNLFLLCSVFEDCEP